LDYQTKVEVTESALVIADGEDKLISLVFTDATEIVLAIPGNALFTDTEFYASAVRRSDIKSMANKLYSDQGIVAAYEISKVQNNDFSAPFTIKLPFITKDNGLIKAMDSLGNEISVPCEQLFISKWRSWETNDGNRVGEWVPLESIVNEANNLLHFETDNTGIYAILGYKNMVKAELLGNVRFTQNPIMPGQDGKRSETTLKFYLAEPCVVKLSIFDTNGRFIATVVDDLPLGEGYHGLSWDGKINGITISRGIYIIQLRVKNDVNSKIYHDVLSVW
jgi:hypothetical protein